MKDSDFQKLLNKLSDANNEYKTILREAEAEYERRFGNSPSDLDDDYWIDTFHVGLSKYETIEDIAKHALSCSVRDTI